jgi:hypothetical protein
VYCLQSFEHQNRGEGEAPETQNGGHENFQEVHCAGNRRLFLKGIVDWPKVFIDNRDIILMKRL